MTTREQLVERLAHVSHATWVLQAVRDYGGTFADPTERDRDRIGSPEWEADVAKARELLAAVLRGGPADDVAEHDRERAENTVAELERLGLWP